LDPGIRDVSSLGTGTEESITSNITIIKAPNGSNRESVKNYLKERSTNLKANTHISSEVGRKGISELMKVSVIESDGETPNDRFIRLSGKRLTNALESIRLLGNLANTASYYYSDDQAADILNALLEANVKLERLFRKGAMARPKTTQN